MPIKKKDVKNIKGKDKSCDCSDDCKCGCKPWRCHCHKGGGALYGLGFIGSAIYFIGHATTFWMGVLGFLKAIVWPVFLTLKIFGM